MSFLRLAENIYLNLAVVASITWFGEGPELSATVKYLGSSSTDQNGQAIGVETFKGEAAQALRKHLEKDTQPSRGHNPQPGFSGLLAPTSAGEESSESIGSRDSFSFNDGQKKSWYLVKDASGQQYFLAMVNAKGSCSMRSFDFEYGRFLKKEYRSGNFRQQYAAILNGAMELHVRRQPNLERDCRESLPSEVLANLKSQVLA